MSYLDHFEDDDDDDLEPLDVDDSAVLEDVRADNERLSNHLHFIALLAKGDEGAIEAVERFFDAQIPKKTAHRMFHSERFGTWYRYTIRHDMRATSIRVRVSNDGGLIGREIDRSKYTVAVIDENTVEIISKEDLRGMRVDLEKL